MSNRTDIEHREQYGDAAEHMQTVARRLAYVLGPVDAASILMIGAAELLTGTLGSATAAQYLRDFADSLARDDSMVN
jgi:hypothetical protein